MIESRLKLRLILPNDLIISNYVNNIKSNESQADKRTKAISDLVKKIMIQDLKISVINVENIIIDKIVYCILYNRKAMDMLSKIL